MSLYKCPKCGNYTLKEKCPKCNESTIQPAPAKFSLEHAKKYGKYRREYMRRTKNKTD